MLPQKEELPEKSARMFKDVKGCDEAKDELQEVRSTWGINAAFIRAQHPVIEAC